MSLYGALFSGVSGLRGQSSKIAMIGDNIANVNTNGYKSNSAIFQTLVTGTGGTAGAYSPGGVLGATKQLVSQQGLLQATSSPTDIAISGPGMFVVNALPDSSGQTFFTRAGSFTQDANGNFRNTAGFYLQAWPLDRSGRLPGEPGNANTVSSSNLTSLEVVNLRNQTGSASSTNEVQLSANLRASESIYPGVAITGGMDPTDAVNANNKSKDIIIPQIAGLDGLIRGDQMTITTNTGAVNTFTYGGFTLGRSVLTGAGGDYGSAVLGAGGGATTLGAVPFSVPDNSAVVTVDHVAHGLQDGDVVTLSANVDILGNIPADDLNGTFVITLIDADSYSITVATQNTSGSAATGGTASTVVEDIRPTDDAGQILDATSVTQSFLGTTGTSIFSSAALSFTISTLTTGTVTFEYKASAPNVQAGEFNNMTNLALAISASPGLAARVNNGRLYVSAINAEEDIIFANGKSIGTDGETEGTALYGIDWIRELGLEADGTVDGASGQFSTMQGLSDLVTTAAEISATIQNPLSDSTVSINADDPLGTIVLADGGSNTGSLIAALGFVDPLGGDLSGVPRDTGTLGPAYDPTDPTKNMSSGSIAPQFSRNVRIYDSLGTGHDINISFIKTGINAWASEVFAVNEDEVSTTLGNGLLTYGNINFNGDGTLLSLDALLATPVTITWTNQAEDSDIDFGWGTAGVTGTGLADGLSQYDSAYKVNFASQNGAPVGELTGVSIDTSGFVTVSYSNGETQRLYKLPLADFANPNGLLSGSGNVYSQTTDSGQVNLAQAGTSGVGKFAPSSLEASNVELADQLTDMIVAQRAYQANTKVITTASTLLDDLNNSIR